MSNDAKLGYKSCLYYHRKDGPVTAVDPRRVSGISMTAKLGFNCGSTTSKCAVYRELQ